LNSVLNKAGAFEFTNDNLEISLISELEAELLVKCLMFNDIVNKAAQEFSPVDIATYTHELAKLFNFYYSENKIISDDNKLQELRLTICLIVKEIMNQSLYLLGIESIDNL